MDRKKWLNIPRPTNSFNSHLFHLKMDVHLVYSAWLPQNGDGISVKSIRTRKPEDLQFSYHYFFLLLPKIQFQNEFPSAVELLMVFIVNILYANIFVFVKLFTGISG